MSEPMSDTVHHDSAEISDRSRDWLRHAATDLVAEVKRLKRALVCQSARRDSGGVGLLRALRAERRRLRATPTTLPPSRACCRAGTISSSSRSIRAASSSVDKPPLGFWIQTARARSCRLSSAGLYSAAPGAGRRRSPSRFSFTSSRRGFGPTRWAARGAGAGADAGERRHRRATTRLTAFSSWPLCSPRGPGAQVR